MANIAKHEKSDIKKSILFMLTGIKNHDKLIILLSSFSVPLNVLNQLLNIYMTVFVIDAVININEKKMICIVLIFIFSKFILSLLSNFIENQLSSRNYLSKMKFVSEFAQKYMKADFVAIESTKGKDMAQRAKNTMFALDFRDKPVVESFLNQISLLFGDICGLFVYAGIISMLNPLILAALIVTACINYFIQKYMVKYDQKDKDKYIPIQRKIYYLIKETKELKSAKDIKLYNMLAWFRDIFNDEIKKRLILFIRRGKYQFAFNTIIAVVNALFSGLIYFYLVQQYLLSNVDIPHFILYFGLITGFNQWLLSAIGDIEGLHGAILNIDDLRNFHDIPEERINQEEVTPHDMSNGIQFVDVSFKYPGIDDALIKKMSFNIASGEKIAIVGINGAGKTTLIKLICGLYSPTEGQIIIGDRDINTISQSTLFKKISVVFQDIYLLPTTIERNITLSEVTDETKLDRVLDLSGLKSKIENLPNKEKTNIIKGILDNATDLSGGEIQKLALARALYKGGDIIIMDEPTAALDPIAENEMYQKYNALLNNATLIFISHRLSSTRFCDRIIFLENGLIMECGSHDELMALGGKYYHMYNMQSHYYKKDAV